MPEFWQFARDLLALLGVLIPAYLAYRLQRLHKEVKEVHVATNSVVQLAVDVATAKGTLEGQRDERTRAAIDLAAQIEKGKHIRRDV